MNMPAVFNFGTHAVRTVERNGEPWFVAKDVADVLGYANPRKAVADHCKAAISGGVTIRDAIGRDQDMTIIPERDVYRLVMRSKLPTAEKFEEWIVAEVLPTIRKTGSYGADPLATLNDPVAMRSLLLSYSEKVLERDKLIAYLEPQANVLREISLADGTMSITDAAKALGVQPQKILIPFLKANRWVYRRSGGKHLIAYQDRIQAGHLDHKVTTVQSSDGGEKITEQVRVTPKGLVALGKLLQSGGQVAEYREAA